VQEVNLLRIEPCYEVKKHSTKKLDKPWFPNAPVGSFGRWDGATWRRRSLGAHREGRRLVRGRRVPSCSHRQLLRRRLFRGLLVGRLLHCSPLHSSLVGRLIHHNLLCGPLVCRLLHHGLLCDLLVRCGLRRTSVIAGAEPLDPPIMDDNCSHFCRGASSSDNTSSSSRTTRTCFFHALAEGRSRTRTTCWATSSCRATAPATTVGRAP
jgi:hypothetical protein